MLPATPRSSLYSVDGHSRYDAAVLITSVYGLIIALALAEPSGPPDPGAANTPRPRAPTEAYAIESATPPRASPPEADAKVELATSEADEASTPPTPPTSPTSPTSPTPASSSSSSSSPPPVGPGDAAPEPAAAPPETPPATADTRRARAGKAPIALRWKLLGELGAIGVVHHRLQFGSNGTELDLRREGRQDTMFVFSRLSTELEVDDHHQIVLVFQPLRLRTETVLLNELVADDVVFPAGTGVELFYGFDFYRVGYAYDFLTDPGDEISLGFSMQFRNFRASYVSNDGALAVANSNFGPVPAIKFRGRHQLDSANFWYGAEVDGFYANIPFVNGGNDPIEGLILDASLRAGFTVAGIVKPYFNLRYLGGGAKGTSTDKVGYGDGFTNNWLHTVALSLGAEVTIPVIKGDRAARDREVAARKAKRRARRGR